MKLLSRRLCSFLLIFSLIFQVLPPLQAGNSAPGNIAFAIRAELWEAQRVLSASNGSIAVGQALPALDRAKNLAFQRDFVRAQKALASNLQEGIRKARLKVLWNDRQDALRIVNRLLGQVDQVLPKGQAQQKGVAPGPVTKPTTPPAPTTPAGNTPGAGTALGVTLIAGLGAVVAALLLGFGQVSHR